MFSLTDYNYQLPLELIAQYPLPSRTASRLLAVEKNTGRLDHLHFINLPQLLKAGDLLVFNNTKVIPARLFGQKATGGKVEILIERFFENNCALAHIKASKSPKPGSIIFLTESIKLEVIHRQDSLYKIRFLSEENSLEVLYKIGHIPLPPYVNRPVETKDSERYQTIYAQSVGAVAAPTAGLHFDEQLFAELERHGIEIAHVTLHVGSGTFQPVRTENIEEHKMHAEYIEVTQEVCEKVMATKARGKRVIAVGTTTVRCLETAAANGLIKAYQGDTQIFIYPGYKFQLVDALITNFHLPQSTLLMLVCSFAGYANTMQAYQEAVKQKYRFFSYGDAMWIG